MKGNHEKAQATLTVDSVTWALARAFSATGNYASFWATLMVYSLFPANQSSKSLGNYDGQLWQSLGNIGCLQRNMGFSPCFFGDGQLCEFLGNTDGFRSFFGNSVVGRFRQLWMGNIGSVWATMESIRITADGRSREKRWPILVL